MIELWHLAVGVAFVAAQFTLAALVIGLYYRPRHLSEAHRQALGASPDTPGSASPLPPLTILMPCEGAEEGLETHLESALYAPYPSPRQVIFCLSDAQDSANAVVDRVLERLQEQPRAGVEALKVFSRRSPADLNRKIQHLSVGYAQARHPVIISADSDVLFEADTLVALVWALVGQAGVGLAYAPPRFPDRGGLADRLLAYGFTSTPHAFYCLKSLADFTRGERPVVGSLMAFRKETLDALGGYRVIAGHIGDDLELGRQIEGLGLRVAVSSETVLCPNPDLSVQSLFWKLHRWIVVGGAYGAWRIFTYPTLLAPLPLVGLLTVLSQATGELLPPYARWAGPLLLALRFLFSTVFGALAYGRRPQALDVILLPVWELFLTLASLLAMVYSVVQWRGRHLLIRRGGAMLSLHDPARPGVPEVPARKNLWGDVVLPLYTRHLCGAQLHAVWVKGLDVLAAHPNAPLLFAPNHACWWDGIIAYLLNILRLKRDFYIMMEDKQLRRYQFFAKAGAFSIRRTHLRSAGQTLRYAEELLSTPGRSLWIFPQGVMVPEDQRPLKFEAGVIHLARRLPNALIVPVSLHYGVRANPRPEVFVVLGTPIALRDAAQGDADRSAQEWTRALEATATAQLDGLRTSLASCPLEQVPPGFECVFKGAMGVAATWDRVRVAVGLLKE